MTFCLGCGTPSTGPRCVQCQHAHKAKYGPEHRAERKAWAPLVAVGTVRCWRCNQTICPGEPWDLGHRGNRASHPEHLSHNRAAGARQVGGRH